MIPSRLLLPLALTLMLAFPPDAVAEDEVPEAKLTLPLQLSEGDSSGVEATLSLNVTTQVPVVFVLSSTPAGQLNHPASVTIPPGQSQVRFNVRATHDTRIEETMAVNLRAASDGLDTVSGNVQIIDDEPRRLDISGATSIQEGEASSVVVRVSGTVTSDMPIRIESVPPGLIETTTPTLIPAGQSQVTIQLRSLQDTVPEPGQSVEITVSAPSFTSDSVGWLLYDDDVAWYEFDPLPESVEAGKSIPIRVWASTVDRGEIERLTLPIELVAELPDGGVVSVTPGPINLLDGEWRGEVTIPRVGASPVRLRVIDGNGKRGVSGDLEVYRRLKLAVRDCVWDPTRGRLYASVSASETGPFANGIVAIDPNSLQIVDSVATGQNPSRLALSGGFERLYVSQDGNGTIAVIDPASLDVLSTFPVGTSPIHGTLYATDMVVVSGQPDLIVAVRERRGASTAPNSIAAYRNGLMLPNVTPEDELGARAIEPSPDPAVMFASNLNSPTSALRTVRISESGVAWETTSPLMELGYSFDFKSDGSTVIFGSGQLFDSGTRLMRAALPDAKQGGLVAPDPPRDLVYMLHQGGFDPEYFDSLSVYDRRTRSRLKMITFPTPFHQANSLVRWGDHGLAWRDDQGLVFMESRALVPGTTNADVQVRIAVDPYPVSASQPHPHLIRVTNHGPDAARGVVVQVDFSGNTAPLNYSSSQGVVDRTSSRLYAALGDLPPGKTATVFATVLPVDAPSTFCRALVRSEAFDPDTRNNLAHRWTATTMAPQTDSVRALPVAGVGLIYDQKRRRLWTMVGGVGVIPGGVGVRPGEAALTWIDPLTGQVSEGSVYVGSVTNDAFAISGNGRYAYVGLTDTSEILRFDLEQDPPSWIRIPINAPDGRPMLPSAIEVLDGDGTSVLVAGFDGSPVQVIDGLVPRAKTATEVTSTILARTGTAGVFVGLDAINDPFPMARLTVTGSGVSGSPIVTAAGHLGSDMATADSLVLMGTGKLFHSGSGALVRDFGQRGEPCIDGANGRAFLVYGMGFHGFATDTGNSLGVLQVAGVSSEDWGGECVRWGLDGLAHYADGRVFLGRWQEVVAPTADANSNGLPDRWEAANLGPFGGDLSSDLDGDGLPNGLEYVFGTPAGVSTVDPRKISVTGIGKVRLEFPRRVGLTPGYYRYEASTGGLVEWEPVTPLQEVVVDTKTVNGVTIETVAADFAFPETESGFVRLIWPAR